ncbi:hypothetical protein QYM36_012786 [Artemia franciscana]|uniref:Uroporphyrinogen-III synthase n=1 Tax=Artemia franciscana TaxID=6661 RepID=A0AA88HTM5_ARTSF|nr:hypothetical protein QYM36_012786 [Artemia franciscana]
MSGVIFKSCKCVNMNKSVLLLKSSGAPQSQDAEDAYIFELKDLFIPFLVNTLSFTFFALDQLWGFIQHPENYSGIILTSPRAVEALKIAIDEFGIQDYETKLLSIWKTKLIYCVGEATQRNALSTLGLEGVGGDTGNAATLGSFILRTFPADERKPLLFPSGELRREELPKILSNANLPFSSIIVYNTTSSPTLEEDIKCCLNSSKGVDYAVFFSPSGVRFAIPVLQSLLSNLNCIKASFVSIFILVFLFHFLG